MASWRNQPRDRQGRWSTGMLAGAAAGAAVGGTLASPLALDRMVTGSLKAESHLGTTRDGKWTGAKVGARYRAPGGRQVVVKGIVGISRTPPPARSSAAQRSASTAATAARKRAARTASSPAAARAGTKATRRTSQAAHRHTGRRIAD
ncbi:hypothetical protein [Lolliginicoccus levis]|uniref:hypothetical protein n=1 Tax=Lolliginicoccus levis TaxID=2919542 RepID=UPI00241E6375|nr:hypothetical protein [Lolliginicoccus levis]